MSTIHDGAVSALVLAKVREFYELLAQGRGDDVATFVEANFAEGATLTRPTSLPGGGTVTGAKSVAKFMRAAASAVSSLTVESIHGSPAADAFSVFAELAVELGGTSTTALEWWTFNSGQVVSVKAYYWDTAALLASSKR